MYNTQSCLLNIHNIKPYIHSPYKLSILHSIRLTIGLTLPSSTTAPYLAMEQPWRGTSACSCTCSCWAKVSAHSGALSLWTVGWGIGYGWMRISGSGRGLCGASCRRTLRRLAGLEDFLEQTAVVVLEASVVGAADLVRDRKRICSGLAWELVLTILTI